MNRRGLPSAGRFAALVAISVADAGYLLGWLLSPAAAWAPWAILIGLAVGASVLVRQLRRCRRGEAPGFPAFCLPLLLPAACALESRRPEPAFAAHRPGAPAPRGEAHRRAGLALLLGAIAALGASGTLGERLVDPVAAPIDAPAERYVDRALVQAGAAYVGTRVLDRLFAVTADLQIDLWLIQGRPGQIFDPLRDLLDRFSTVILVALGSLTLQKILLQLAGDVALPFLVAGAAGALALGIVVGRERWARPLWAASGLLLGTAVFLRLLLPLMALTVAAISDHALAERQVAALGTIERAAGRVGIELTLTAPTTAPDAATDGRSLGRSISELEESARALRHVDEGWLQALFDAFVDLVAVFLIETILAPLAVLFLFWRLWRRSTRPPPGVP